MVLGLDGPVRQTLPREQFLLLTSRLSCPGDWNSPPNDPPVFTAPDVRVDRISFFAFANEFIFASISTPAEA